MKTAAAFFLVPLLLSTAVFAFSSKDGAIPDVAYREVSKKMLRDFPYLTEKDIKITLSNREDYVFVSKNVGTFEFDTKAISSLLGKTAIPVIVYDKKGMLIQRSFLNVEVQASGPIISLTRDLKKGDIVSEKDVITTTADIYGTPPHRILSANDAIGKEVLYPVTKDTILTQRHIRTAPAIHRGNAVSLLIKNGSLEIKVKGEAMDDGYKGDTIRVRSLLDKHKILEGMVLDEEKISVRILN